MITKSSEENNVYANKSKDFLISHNYIVKYKLFGITVFTFKATLNNKPSDESASKVGFSRTQ